jgi:hypothetical protein
MEVDSVGEEGTDYDNYPGKGALSEDAFVNDDAGLSCRRAFCAKSGYSLN